MYITLQQKHQYNPPNKQNHNFINSCHQKQNQRNKSKKLNIHIGHHSNKQNNKDKLYILQCLAKINFHHTNYISKTLNDYSASFDLLKSSQNKSRGNYKSNEKNKSRGRNKNNSQEKSSQKQIHNKFNSKYLKSPSKCKYYLQTANNNQIKISKDKKYPRKSRKSANFNSSHKFIFNSSIKDNKSVKNGLNSHVHETYNLSLSTQSQENIINKPTLKSKFNSKNQYQNPQIFLRQAYAINNISNRQIKLNSNEESITSSKSYQQSGQKINWKKCVKLKVHNINARVIRINNINKIMKTASLLSLNRITVHHAISILDLYYKINSKNLKSQQQYELAAISCLFISTKLQKAQHPSIYQFLQLIDNRFSKEEVFQMEIQIGKKLIYKLNPKTHLQYLNQTLQKLKQFKKSKVSLPQINSFSQQNLYWMLDGIMIEQLYYEFSGLKLSLALIYLILKKQEYYPINPQKMKKLLSNLQKLKIGRLQVIFQSFMNYCDEYLTCFDDIKFQIKAIYKWIRFQCKCKKSNGQFDQQDKDIIQQNQNSDIFIYHSELKVIINKFFIQIQ